MGQERGRELLRELVMSADVFVENFRPGTMEKWGLGPDVFEQQNPGLIYTRISGYGQTGPYAPKAGFASVCEAFGGFRYVNGFPGEAPVRPNLSTGDTVAGLHATLGICLALLARERGNVDGGQEIDVALYESMFNLLEAVIPEFSGAGVQREPSGTTVERLWGQPEQKEGSRARPPAWTASWRAGASGTSRSRHSGACSPIHWRSTPATIAGESSPV